MGKTPETEAEWDAEAARLGVESGAVLREQVALSEEILAEVLAEEKIPDVCDTFEYQGSVFRATAHLAFVKVSGLGGKWWRYVERAEATHVAGSGVCGCIAPVGEVKAGATVEWTPEMIAAERDRARARISEKILA